MKQKQIHVLKVAPKEHPEEVYLENTLSALQEAVGGLIEIISLDDDNVCLLCNEEGKINGLEGNRAVGHDIIVGTFYIIGEDREGNLTSLTDAQMDAYTKRFYEPESFTQDEINARLGFTFISM